MIYLPTKVRPLFVLLSLVGWIATSALGGCHGEPIVTLPDGAPTIHCTAEPPSTEAMRTTGPHPDGGVILPGGRRVRPWGQIVSLAGFPLNLVVLPDDRHLVVTGSGFRSSALWLIDGHTGTIRDGVEPDQVFYGLDVNAAATRLYAGGGDDGAVYVYDLDLENGLLLPQTPLYTETFAGAVALTRGVGGRVDQLLVADHDGRHLAVVDLASQTQIERMLLGRNPYDIQVDAARGRIYVTLCGDDALWVLRADTLELVETLPMEKNPQNMVRSPDGRRLYVVNTDADVLTVIDLDRLEIEQTVAVDPIGSIPRGISPSHVALSADGTTLFITSAGLNAVLAYDAVTLAPLGAVPAAWYPSAVAVSHGGDRLYIVNAKGFGTGPSAGTSAKSLMAGNLQITTRPDRVKLRQGEAQALADFNRPTTVSPGLHCAAEPAVFPVPAERGGPTPINHVLLLVRENKTYDAELGDLETGAGDPDLVLFGEWETPNLHALARQFTNLDNFYTNGEVSIQGHYWLTAGMVNDYTERVVLEEGGGRSYANFGVMPVGFPQGSFLWGHLESLGIDFVNWGEIMGVMADGDIGMDQDFPGITFNMNYLDVDKARYVASRILDEGFLPTFAFLLLPNNHTFGAQPGKPTPASMVADNDEATGIVVEAVSQSPFWNSTVIFIVEDDPQQGGDHIDAHRSICLVVSPWAKRGHTSHVHHDLGSLWATIGTIIDMAPLSLYDATAAPMYDAFSATRDSAPYTHIERNVPQAVNAPDAVGAKKSAAMDFSRPDQEVGLARLLWKIVKGSEPPWPARPKWPEQDQDEQ